MKLTPNSIRAKLTLWQVAIMALILALFALGIYAYVRESLFAQIDTRLDSSLRLIESSVRANTAELGEIERHTQVIAFRVMEGDWPLYISGGWIAADLDKFIPPRNGRWVVSPARGGIYHLKQKTLTLGKRQFQLSTAENAEQLHRGLDRLALTLSIGFPVAALLSLLGGYFLAGRMLIPLQHITTRARNINENNLADRLLIANTHDELGQLGNVLNDAFSRLEMSFTRLKQFTQDAAHELRTPLAVLRSVGEVGLEETRDAHAYREIIGSMLEEVDRLAQLVNGLLTLARAESGQYSVQRQPEDLQLLCKEVVECLRVLAEEKQQTLTFDAPQSVIAAVDHDTVRLALMNLVANAIRYTAAHGTIRVALESGPDTTLISVRDNGPGIDPAHHDKIFERFYRIDSSRSQQSGGTGLGLAIARWAVAANGGTIHLESIVGHGSQFKISLPGTTASEQTLRVSG